ncbi:dTDP-4-dehydrorhamnose 3,5-epimerase [Tardiphaga sp. vice278]|uniref:dTDP-4-dehydrorhamnose 3,5-epimerase n=1 Tax=Tardiphaga sp. vice278 TaxID=2592815 RepID=UPI00116275C8|nr:dTDP-4-dehydrorhamnose 3,5-epimerase [Tardiphaga sp. vice278]QDM17943.1 dTDP-4-dehydrorhamnose 3,5-epimerase [Tardiphaga sp. vice278]
MQVERFDIADLLLLAPVKHGDERGFFSETFRVDVLAANGVDLAFVQDNHARSTQKGVLRGLHFQNPPRAQGKLVRCSLGSILDVAVDIRPTSATYGRHVAVRLSADNWQQLWVPPGFAHGYITLEPVCEVIYKVTDYYAPECDRGIAWDDPALAIDWQVSAADVVLSEKDRRQPRLADLAPAF